MDVNHTETIIQKIRSILLVFFCLSLFYACQKNETKSKVSVNYELDRATSISFQTNYTIENLSVHLKGVELEILGQFEQRNKQIEFTPAVPFTNGKTYQLRYQQGTITEFSIKAKSDKGKPKVLAIYPSTDSVPENLLKMYIQFSKPMQEVGSSLDYITVLDEDDNELSDIFLALENELWNKEHTLLTLWLDPGRIKKDLIPNKEKGLPLNSGYTYRLKVNDAWKDAEGFRLHKGVEKKLIVTDRKNTKPNISSWKLEKPQLGTKDPLLVEFNEPLDAQLLRECFAILDDDSTIIEGRISLIQNEQGIAFIPSEDWKKGTYKLKILSILEDLAGNNLNRLFDTDLEATPEAEPSSFKTLNFILE